MLYRRFAFAFALLVALTLLGGMGYAWLEGWDLADGLYMAVITVGTVGYGETHPLSADGRLYTIVFILLSTGVMVYATSSLTAIIVEGGLLELFKRRKMNNLIKTLSGHYLVCGDSSIGVHIIEELKRTDQNFIVIDRNEEKVKGLIARDIPAICGEATLDATLIEAGVERAAGLITTLHTDADNLFVVLTARRLNPGLRIIAKAIDEATRDKLQQVGADGIVMPEAIGGMRMVSELLRPEVVSFLDVMLRNKDATIRVDEIRIKQGDPAIGRSLAETGITTTEGATLVAVSRGEQDYRFNPPPETRLIAGDILVMLGNTQVIQALERHLSSHSIQS